MATVRVISEETQGRSAAPFQRSSKASPLLREWLQGDWAMIFSHPIDFQYQGLEIDRWLAIVHEEFQERGVRALSCRRQAALLDPIWAAELLADQRPISIEPVNETGIPEIIDLPARALRDELLGLSTRFVLIVDDKLRRRGVFKYSTGGAKVSPLDLLTSIEAMRRRGADRIAA
jgi:alkyl hydroperoxide reductase subunit AhpC